MDAYIFSKQATPDAVAALGAGVGDDGPARVVLPLIGSHALFVAVEASDDADLNQRIAAVVGTSGLGECSTFLASAPDVTFFLPVHAAVDNYVGFCLVAAEPGLSVAVYTAAKAVAGVTGAGVVTGAGYSVLVEATAADPDAVATILNQVAGLPGVRAAATATGSTALGFGLSRGTT